MAGQNSKYCFRTTAGNLFGQSELNILTGKKRRHLLFIKMRQFKQINPRKGIEFLHKLKSSYPNIL